MAHIFKYPSNNSKGIIVFTHKELIAFSFNASHIRRFRRNPSTIINNVFLSFFFKRKINSLRENFLIGIHLGLYATNVDTTFWVDFHMTSPGTATFNSKQFVIPLSSAHFTPSVMRQDENCEKYWDIICVAKNTRGKNIDKLLDSIRRIYDLKKNYKILIIIATNRSESNFKYYNEIMADYFKKFTPVERENLTIIRTHPDTGFQGLSYSTLSYFYNRSKIFTLFSEIEGHAKVVKEAQLCGLPIVVKSDLKGGVKDSLTSENSSFFIDFESAHETLIKAVEHYKDYKVIADYWASELREDFTIEKLKEHFHLLYEFNSLKFDGKLENLDNLNRRLPAHFYDPKSIPWASSLHFRYRTTDICNYKMFVEFLSYIKQSL